MALPLTPNVEVQARDAVSSQRVPWNGGFGVNEGSENATNFLE
jgi:hypothetical protein